MTPAEAAILLGMAATVDNRKPDEDAAKAWATMLNDLRFDDCREAIIEHYKHTTDWLMPSHIRATVRRIRARRVEAFGVLPDPPPGIDGDPAAYRRYIADTTRAIADGTLTRDQADAQTPELPARDMTKIQPAGLPMPADIRHAYANRPRREEQP